LDWSYSTCMALSGWIVRVTANDGAGKPAVYEDFIVCEPDKERAAELAELRWGDPGRSIQVRCPANLDQVNGLKRGDIKSA
jgi:hypothetical protein